MMPAQYPLTLYRGDTYSWQFVLWQDAAQTTPVDLSVVTPKAEIRNQPAGSLIIPLTLTITLPNIINAALDATSSAQLPLSGVWDLQLTWQDSTVATVLAGAVYVAPDVTDSSPPAPAPGRVRLVA